MCHFSKQCMFSSYTLYLIAPYLWKVISATIPSNIFRTRPTNAITSSIISTVSLWRSIEYMYLIDILHKVIYEAIKLQFSARVAVCRDKSMKYYSISTLKYTQLLKAGNGWGRVYTCIGYFLLPACIIHGVAVQLKMRSATPEYLLYPYTNASFMQLLKGGILWWVKESMYRLGPYSLHVSYMELQLSTLSHQNTKTLCTLSLYI